MSDAIPASTVRCQTMADGTLRVTLDVEPSHAQAAFALLGSPGQPCAIVALKTANQAQAAERAKGGNASKWLGMRCGEPAFQAWLADQWPKQWSEAIGATDTLRAASVVRAVCHVQSRAEIDNDQAKFARFDRLIRQPWAAFCATR